MVRVLVGALLLTTLPMEALACRCEQRPLGEYFAAAELVAMAELVASENVGDDRHLTFRLRSAPYKGDAYADDTSIAVVTSASTASCGVPPDVGAIYVVFAYPDAVDPERIRVDSCSGTRVHLSTSLEEPVGFVDVPARFVAGQLNALMGIEILRDVSRNGPLSDDPANDRLLGLLDLKALAHGGITPLHSTPDSDSPIVAVVRDWKQIERREIGYEVNAAVVHQWVPGWYRLRLADGTSGWAEARDAGTWFAYADLPVGRLAYLTGSWSGLLWPSPGAGVPMRYSVFGDLRKREYAVNVLESTLVGGMPFFRVEFLDSSPCEAAEPTVRGVGWLPAYDTEGEPAVWYYSRGC